MCLCVHVCVHVYMCGVACAGVHVYMCGVACACVYVCMCVHVRACMRVCVCMGGHRDHYSHTFTGGHEGYQMAGCTCGVSRRSAFELD
jgi:hypothetical protein